MANFRGVKLKEIKQTYYLLKFAMTRSNGSIFSELQHNTKCPS